MRLDWFRWRCIGSIDSVWRLAWAMVLWIVRLQIWFSRRWTLRRTRRYVIIHDIWMPRWRLYRFDGFSFEGL